MTTEQAPDGQHILVQAAAALADGAWQEAYTLYAGAVAGAETPEALEGLSWAAWWLDDAPTIFAAREKAYRLYRAGGDRRGAARMALWLAMDYVDFRGEAAIASGWRQRARRLLDGLELAPEHGWLAIVEGEFAIVVKDDTHWAKRLADEAVETGRSLEVPDLEMIGLAMKGLALVTEGQIEDGMSCLDEAAVTASSDDLQVHFSPAWVSCYLIYACERVRDFDRAEQWCRRMEEISRQLRYRLWFGICRTHYAGVLIWRGAWKEAEEELIPATAHLEAARPPSAVEGLVRLGELRRRQGKLEEAEAIFMRADGHAAALLGLAELALDRDKPGEARSYVDRLLRRLPNDSRTQRLSALEVAVRVHAALGDHEKAATAVHALETVAEALGTEPLRAAAGFSTGVLAALAGDHERAQHCFEDALDLYQRCHAPFEAARTRVELAKVLIVSGEREAARKEAEAAVEAFRRLEAERELDKAVALLQGLSGPSQAPDGPMPLSSLTRRELEVLQLVAEGLSDKHIAARLILSEHTVHRHIANILNKLGLSTRAAAVAYAARNDLL